MDAGKDVERLLDTLYGAVSAPDSWSSVCDGLAQVAGGVGAVMIPDRSEMRTVGLPHSASMQESFDLYLKESWFQHDVRDKGIPTLMRMGVMFDQDMVTPDEVARLPYYQEFLRPCRLKWFAGIGFRVQGRQWAASIQRSSDQRAFRNSDRRLLRQLGGHLSRAANLAATFGFARMEGASEAFQRMAVGALALDRLGRVVMVNAAARHVLRDGLIIANGRLHCSESERGADVEALVRGAIAPAGLAPAGLPESVAVRRPSGKRPLQLVAYPLRSASVAVFDQIAALILIVDPEVRRVPATEVLRKQFGLTRSEARLAEALAAGSALADAADVLSLTEETARFYLKSILSKTDTHRQGALVALLASLAVVPRSPEERS